jgi:predicted ATPase
MPTSHSNQPRRALLLTIFGQAGVGKSRLAREFTAGAERATVLSGRCLPYGEGVTYWPLAAMIKASAGITDDAPASEAFERLRLCCESEAVADLLAVALGVLGAAENGRSASATAFRCNARTVLSSLRSTLAPRTTTSGAP